MKQRGLGKGLGALLGELKEEGVTEIDLNLIDPNSLQARKKFDEEGLAELAQSIKQYGVVQPILVNYAAGRYTIIAGERRWRASRIAGKTSIPAIVKNLDEPELLEVSLIENLQREDLNPVEEAEGLRQLIDSRGLTQEELAERIGKSRPHIANMLRLLRLPEKVLDLLRSGSISAGHARCLVALDDAGEQIRLARAVVEGGLSVRQLETLLKKKKGKRHVSERPKPLELREAEAQIREIIGTKVTLKGSMKQGKIILEYYSSDDLQRIVDRLLDRQK